MKIDFRNIKVTGLDGEIRSHDISKLLGNAIYAKTADLGELELAREIYKAGEVEINPEQAAFLNRYIKDSFLAFIQESICPVLEGIN